MTLFSAVIIGNRHGRCQKAATKYRNMMLSVIGLHQEIGEMFSCGFDSLQEFSFRVRLAISRISCGHGAILRSVAYLMGWFPVSDKASLLP